MFFTIVVLRFLIPHSSANPPIAIDLLPNNNTSEIKIYFRIWYKKEGKYHLYCKPKNFRDFHIHLKFAKFYIY